jgi:hypothetical protein
MFSQTKTLSITAHQRTRIIHRVSNSVPAQFQLTFTPNSATGKLEIEKSAVMIDKKSETHALETTMTLKVGYWDAFYSAYVTPETDVTLEISNPGGVPVWVMVVGLIVILVSSALVVFSSL